MSLEHIILSLIAFIIVMIGVVIGVAYIITRNAMSVIEQMLIRVLYHEEEEVGIGGDDTVN